MDPKTFTDAEVLPLWDGGVADPLETRYSRTCVTMHAKFGHAKVKLREGNYWDSPENFDLSRPDFPGHSKSLELLRIDQLPMTSY